MKTRLFVGGLNKSTIQDSDVVKLFSSFGRVEDFERIPDKEYAVYFGSVHRDVYERSFAYVSLEVEEEKHAKRAVGALNGTKWKGCSLRCQFAKPSGIEKVLNEIKTCEDEKEEDGEGKAGQSISMAEAPQRLKMAPFPSSEGGCIVIVPVRGDESNNPQQKYFESDDNNDDGCSVVVESEKKWDAIDTPRHVYSYERHLQELQAGAYQQGCSTDSSSGDGVPRQRLNEPSGEEQSNHFSYKKKESAQVHKGSKRSKADEDASKVAATAVETILKRQRLGIVQSLNPRLRTVNFFNEEDAAGGNVVSKDVDLSRFDSDSDDAGQRIPQVDGAMDSSSDPSSSTSSSFLPESPMRVSSSSSQDATSNDNDTNNTSKEEKEEENSQSQAHVNLDVKDDDEHDHELEQEISTLYKIFPNAANFKRRDPIEHVEAQWRAEKDSLLKELKEMRRQALRTQGEKKNSGKRMV
eukprot:jgi/Picsp_1/4743/NSC_02112-R1_nucleolar protein 8-like